MYIIQLLLTLVKELHLALHLKNYQRIGAVLFAVLGKSILVLSLNYSLNIGLKTPPLGVWV
jgi:hypothetical protein